jgi:hypothetical protein
MSFLIRNLSKYNQIGAATRLVYHVYLYRKTKQSFLLMLFHSFRSYSEVVNVYGRKQIDTRVQERKVVAQVPENAVISHS